MSAGEVTEAVLSEATSAGYGSIATGRNSFRFTRSRRRPLFTSSLETFDLSVFDRRGGVSVHLSGTIRVSLLESVRGRLHEGGHRPVPTGLPSIPDRGPLAGGQHRLGGVATTRPIAAAPGWLPSVTNEAASICDAEPTVLRPRSWSPAAGPAADPAAGVTIRFSNGEARSLPVGGLVIGRDPTADPQLPGAQVVRIDDLSLSRTHLSVGVDGGTVWILDRHSTNGASIEVGGRTSPCVPGVRTTVPPGGTVLFGGQRFVVDVR